jgi:hypothetical protein
MPHGAPHLMVGRQIDHLSPRGYSVPTPGSDINVATPSVSADSPSDAPSPTKTLLRKKQALDRGHLFLQGRYDELLRSLDKDERMWVICTSSSFIADSATVSCHSGYTNTGFTRSKLPKHGVVVQEYGRRIYLDSIISST